ncbi:MAG: hemerythrin domain-containing protein [Alphaproteobacteria bacterium]|nr:hemerythrin domain-containing protein [Alphaproteobacteria bacterium]
MDIYALIREDHQRVKALFEKLESETGGSDGRASLFGTLKMELTRHKEAEEATFYAALSLLPEISDRIEEALEEHVDIDELLRELDDIDDDSESFMAQLAELREEVEHHVGEEENEIFPRARELLTDAQAEKIAAEMQAYKQKMV